jgi:hypothetical protein
LKDFRTLGLKANTPSAGDTTKYNDWKVKMQQVFSAGVQPYIPMFKEGKYAEALIAAIGNLAVGIKKEF